MAGVKTIINNIKQDFAEACEVVLQHDNAHLVASGRNRRLYRERERGREREREREGEREGERGRGRGRERERERAELPSRCLERTTRME